MFVILRLRSLDSYLGKDEVTCFHPLCFLLKAGEYLVNPGYYKGQPIFDVRIKLDEPGLIVSPNIVFMQNSFPACSVVG